MRASGASGGLFGNRGQASNNINVLSNRFSDLGGAPFASGSAPDIQASVSTVLPLKFGNNIDQSFPINTHTNTTTSQPASNITFSLNLKPSCPSRSLIFTSLHSTSKTHN